MWVGQISVKKHHLHLQSPDLEVVIKLDDNPDSWPTYLCDQ